jgi:hypothetical protein
VLRVVCYRVTHAADAAERRPCGVTFAPGCQVRAMLVDGTPHQVRFTAQVTTISRDATSNR